jgi:hypothetical protein
LHCEFLSDGVLVSRVTQMPEGAASLSCDEHIAECEDGRLARLSAPCEMIAVQNDPHNLLSKWLPW